MQLTLDYFQQEDVLKLGQDLLGKYLMTHMDGLLTGGQIVEVEVYRGPEDRASHAWNNRRTKRNAVMYEEGGACYVYWCYGIHALFNIVAHKKEVPHAILIRAIQPEIGVETMLERRKSSRLSRATAGGPGALTQALGITVKHNGLLLTGPFIWVEDRGVTVPLKEIVCSPRVGIDYAGEDALLPWRYRIKDNLWTSPAK
ncbi:DNA-3-methyladenine glycosylase [Parachlamydia sp. AcF125]|uniref:DNA-3-methyladenine glycosylase n=1 Tax=Parachlamydia sp. AcF125 TaxID=2795736 RepID=UPI001BCA09EF|nr:DNA-3-methyladenine glycosylase [Parachlamydia sp. AcF125]MBS4169164.1 putative 3-methyladenine DNA glycosylase [Parachlamydia sp. AcF125]